MELREEQQMIRDMVREFAAAELTSLVEELEATQEFPAAVQQKLAGLNLLGLTLPEEAGGAGVDTLSCCLVLEELASVSAAVALVTAAHNLLVLPVLQACGTIPERLKELAVGKRLGAFAWQERDAASPARVTRQDDHIVLQGEKGFVTGATAAADFVVSVSATDGVSLFHVGRDAAGVDVTPVDALAFRGSGTGHVAFHDVRLPASACMAKGTPAAQLLQATHARAQLGLAAVALGVARVAFHRALRYAREREQFDRHLADLQAIQWKLSDTDLAIHAARLVLYDAAQAEPLAVLDASRARVLANEAAMRSADHAVQVHGGYGYCAEYHVERQYRDAKAAAVTWGSNSEQRLALAHELLQKVESGALQLI